MKLHSVNLLISFLLITTTFISCRKEAEINTKRDPIISWENPSGIPYGTLLSSAQLNASTGVFGQFSYYPSFGTRLDFGNAQVLEVIFYPDDTKNYNSVKKSVKIDVFQSDGYNTIFNPDLIYNELTDQDGNTYKTIKIGTQTWMAENLKTTKYRNGDPVENVTDGPTWDNLNIGAYCWQNNDVENKINFGALYNWFAVNDSRNIAPVGWGVPSDEDWKILIDYLGGFDIAGAKMKETGLGLWSYTSPYVTNESGFTAVPSGYRSHGFDNFGHAGTFWSSTQGDGLSAWDYALGSDKLSCGRGSYPMEYGFAVRCIKND